jgi:AcrR family transcriptional regulator
LSKDRVLRAAIGLADERGIESVTMRRLAHELGVEAMSLYYYVAKKDDILNAIVDLVVSEIELPSPGADWKAAIRKTAISAHDVLVRHPWAASLMLSATGASPARWRYVDAILGCLREADFSADMTDHAYHALDSHITGFTLSEVQFQIDPETLPELAATFLRELPVDKYPHLVEHVHQHLKERSPDDEGAFAFGLDLILDGLERIRDTA